MEFEYKGGTYCGEAKDGVPNGYGILLLPNGAQMGNWENGELTSGCEYIGDSLYVGRYKNGEHAGTGLFANESGEMHKRTDFSDYGFLNRDVIIDELSLDAVDTSGWEFKILTCGIYKGQTKDGVPHGQGRMVFIADDFDCRACYFGEFKNGKPDGKGLLHYRPYSRNECISYEGEFLEGAFEGKGCLQIKDGYCKGNWSGGYLEGDGNEQTSGYNIWNGIFKEGWFVSGKLYNSVFKFSHDGEIDYRLRPSRHGLKRNDDEFWEAII